MSTTEASTMSKSARQRANKKARDDEAAAAVVAEAAAVAAPKAKGKAKAKAEAAAPAPAAAAPKAKGKAKAKAEAAPAPAPAPAAAAPKAKGEAKAKAKGKAKAKAEEEAPVKKDTADGLPPVELDDGKGGDWEVSTGVSKQKQKQVDRAEAKAKEEAALKKAGLSGKAAQQHIPGMANSADLLAAAKAKDAQGGLAKGGQTHLQKAQAAIARVTAEAAIARKDAAAGVAAAGSAAAPAAAPVDPNLTTASVKIDASKIGRIIGPKGANITLIKEKTGVKTIDTAGDLCTIVGLPDAVALAEHAIRELTEKGYMSLSFEDFKEDGVMVHPSMFPLIIGERGCIIQAIKKEAKVEIDIPAVPKNGVPSAKKYKVSLAGSKESVAKGIEILESIIKHGYHEITHPGFSHAEMEVEEWKYRFLIGPGGSEMRHIQNNFKVKVNIPRETSETDKVVVIGEPADVERAVKYMEKRLFEAEQPKGRDAPEKKQDDDGGDDPVEDWMKPYMYKR